MNQPNIFEQNMQYQKIMNSMNANSSYSNYLSNKMANPMIMAFEKNRSIKDDTILHYVVGFSFIKFSSKYDYPKDVMELSKVKGAYCLLGFSKSKVYFQHYSTDGQLATTFAFEKEPNIKMEIMPINKAHGGYNVKFIQPSKEYIMFSIPNNIPQEKGVRPFYASFDQTMAVNALIDGLKNKNIFV